MTTPTTTAAQAATFVHKRLDAALPPSSTGRRDTALQADEAEKLGVDHATFRRIDGDKDGNVTQAELAKRFERLDAGAMGEIAAAKAKAVRHTQMLWGAGGSVFGGMALAGAMVEAGSALGAAAFGVGVVLFMGGIALGLYAWARSGGLWQPKDHAAMIKRAGAPDPAEEAAEKAEAAREAAAPPAVAAQVAPTKAGLTSHSDHLMSKGPIAVRALGPEPAALADAKQQAIADGRDQIIVATAAGQVVASSLEYTVPTGPMPKAGEAITLNGPTGAIQGTVTWIDAEASRVRAEAEAKKAAAARPSGTAYVGGTTVVIDRRDSLADSYAKGQAAADVVNGAASLIKGVYRHHGGR